MAGRHHADRSLTLMIVAAEDRINIGPLIAARGVGLDSVLREKSLGTAHITGVFIQLENAINTRCEWSPPPVHYRTGRRH